MTISSKKIRFILKKGCKKVLNYYFASTLLSFNFFKCTLCWISSKEKNTVIYKTLYPFVDNMKENGKDIEITEVDGLGHSELVSGATLSIDSAVADWFLTFE